MSGEARMHYRDRRALPVAPLPLRAKQPELAHMPLGRAARQGLLALRIVLILLTGMAIYAFIYGLHY
jgi:hypothetical protein